MPNYDCKGFSAYMPDINCIFRVKTNTVRPRGDLPRLPGVYQAGLSAYFEE
jgi:hypothetical protein